MSTTITTAKIKNKMFLAYGYTERSGDIENKITTASDAPIHIDLQNAFNRLTPHFAFICEEISEDLARNSILNFDTDFDLSEDALKKFKVNGFTIGGSGDSEGVVISGNKSLESGKVVNFNTPFIKWEDDYLFSSELTTAMDILKSEVYEYLEGKQAPKLQIAITFESNDDDEDGQSQKHFADAEM
jgi:hypothetical protein